MKTLTKRPTSKSLKLQCSTQRIDKNTVLLSVGEVFLKTDNKGVADLITALTRLLKGDASCQHEAKFERFQTNPLLDISPKKSADVSALAPTPLHPSCQIKNRNKFPSRHPHRVVTLFCVASYN